MTSLQSRCRRSVRNLTNANVTVNATALGRAAGGAQRRGRIVLRTYLTSAAGYRRHLAGGSASDALKDGLLDLHLPHFTWITEISTIDSYNQSSPGLRRIYGHTVLDATSTGKGGDGLLVLHLPGLLFTSDINAPPRIQRNSPSSRTTGCTSAARSVSSP